MQRINRIILPVDRSDTSKMAAEQGILLAKLLDVDVAIITVDDSHQFVVSTILEEKLQKENEAVLEEYKKMAEERGTNRVITELFEGTPAEEIVRFANENDLIVMSSRGKKGLNKFILGSVSEEVLHRAPCSVMIIKPHSSEEHNP